MAKKQNRIFNLSQIIVIGVLVPITFLFLDASDVVDFRVLFDKTYRTFFNVSHERIVSINDLYTKVQGTFVNRLEQEERIQTLEQQLVRQQLVLDNLLVSKKENERLSELLALKQSLGFEVIFSRVLAYDPENHFTTIIIGKGSADGILANKPVLAYQGSRIGLVGFVLRVEENFSEIRTILDQRTQISLNLMSHNSLALANGQSRASTLLEVNFIDIRLEDILYENMVTSGLGQRYPFGVFVGSIVDVERAKYGLFQKAYLRPAIDFFSLKEVFVLLENRDFDPGILSFFKEGEGGELSEEEKALIKEQILSGINSSSGE